MGVSCPNGFDQFGDGLALVALGFVGAGELKLTHEGGPLGRGCMMAWTLGGGQAFVDGQGGGPDDTGFVFQFRYD